jgi:hypothetical protein
MILNESFDFENQAPEDVKRAFVGGKPEAKLLLYPRTKLYKWTDHSLVTTRGITPW